MSYEIAALDDVGHVAKTCAACSIAHLPLWSPTMIAVPLLVTPRGVPRQFVVFPVIVISAASLPVVGKVFHIRN